MLKSRLIFGVVGALAAIAILTFTNIYVIAACITAITLIGLFEFYRATGILQKHKFLSAVGFLFTVVSAAIVIFTVKQQHTYLLTAIFTYMFLLLVYMVLKHDTTSFSDISVSFFGGVYISIFFLHILLTRQLPYGKLLIWLIFISAWMTDTFAYIFGRTMGKHKLIPKVSPKKTVEGAVGGILGCILCDLLYVYLIASYTDLHVNYLSAIILFLIASVFSQVGDLAASCIKREHGVKDYGKLLPGHGGILDRFDSVLLISPLVYYFVLYFTIFMR